MPYGQLSFSATTTPNGLVTFTLAVLPAHPIDYVKLVGGSWLSFTWNGETGAQINGNIVSITIRDNGRGDSDLTPGVATDPGAPVFAAVIPATGADSRTPLQLAAMLALAGVGSRIHRPPAPVRDLNDGAAVWCTTRHTAANRRVGGAVQ